MSVENSRSANKVNDNALNEYQQSMERNKVLKPDDLILVKNVDGHILRKPIAGIIIANVHPMTRILYFSVRALEGKSFPVVDNRTIELNRILDWSFGQVTFADENEG